MIQEDNNLPQADGSEKPQKEEGQTAIENTSEDSRDENELNKSKDEFEEVPIRDYSTFNTESLVSEVNHLLSNFPVNQISKAVNSIKKEFGKKLRKEENQVKEKFLEEGGKPEDFDYRHPDKDKFNHLISEYKKQLNAFYKNLEQKQKENLDKRHKLIDELKSLYQDQHDNNSELFREFRRIKSEWHDAGRVPSAQASDVFRTYFHHLDNFYEFLDLNKDLQQLDYEHNLETRKTIIERAESLLKEDNIRKALNELQYLHKLWKEEAVPVAEEHREPTWNRFKEITQQLHDRKQEFYHEQKEKEVENQKFKVDIIARLKEINKSEENNHGFFQKTLKNVENLRQSFINSGRAPRSENQNLWDEFKSELRAFNRKKNKFYKEIKSNQNDNLKRKQELLKKAKENVEREDWDEAVNFYKGIQQEWKNVGMVPRKFSNEIWKEFNQTCNEFFERFKNRNQKNLEELKDNLAKKQEYLKKLDSEDFKGLSEDELMDKMMKLSNEWEGLGLVPRNEKKVESDFKNKLESLIKESGAKTDLSTIRTKLKVNKFKKSGDEDLRNDTLRKIRSQMDEINSELAHLENNLSFFANADQDNPLLNNVHKDIESKNQRLASLKQEYDSLRHINFNEPEPEEEQSGEE